MIPAQAEPAQRDNAVSTAPVKAISATNKACNPVATVESVRGKRVLTIPAWECSAKPTKHAKMVCVIVLPYLPNLKSNQNPLLTQVQNDKPENSISPAVVHARPILADLGATSCGSGCWVCFCWQLSVDILETRAVGQFDEPGMQDDSRIIAPVSPRCCQSSATVVCFCVLWVCKAAALASRAAAMRGHKRRMTRFLGSSQGS